MGVLRVSIKEKTAMLRAGEQTSADTESVDHGDEAQVFEGTDVPLESLFDCLDNGYNLYIFLDRFPSVSLEQGLAAIEKRVSMSSVIHSDRKTVSGTPIFKGSRVPVKNLFDYLEGGHDLDAFLDDFPSVSRGQATAALNSARMMLEKDAYAAAAG